MFTALGKIGRNAGNVKADGDENKYALAYQEYYHFGTTHGYLNHMKLKKKYQRS